jgi:hypothetical protein
MNAWVGLGFFVVLCILVLLWWLFPILTGLPWRPTSTLRIMRALELSDIRPGETIYDLGSGDGRVLMIAARDFNALAVGIEISPLHRYWSQFLLLIMRLGNRVEVRRENFYHCNLRDADVVFAYMTSAQVSGLKPHLENQLRPGSRVVTVSFDIDGWEPDEVDREHLIFLYHMPPRAGNLVTFLEKTG